MDRRDLLLGGTAAIGAVGIAGAVAAAPQAPANRVVKQELARTRSEIKSLVQQFSRQLAEIKRNIGLFDINDFLFEFDGAVVLVVTGTRSALLSGLARSLVFLQPELATSTLLGGPADNLTRVQNQLVDLALCTEADVSEALKTVNGLVIGGTVLKTAALFSGGLLKAIDSAVGPPVTVNRALIDSVTVVNQQSRVRGTALGSTQVTLVYTDQNGQQRLATRNVDAAGRFTDLQTFQDTACMRRYVNPLSRPGGPVQDTQAFATCP